MTYPDQIYVQHDWTHCPARTQARCQHQGIPCKYTSLYLYSNVEPDDPQRLYQQDYPIHNYIYIVINIHVCYLTTCILENKV